MNIAQRHALHIVHGYNEPFLSLSNQYSRALQSDGWQVTTVYLTGVADETVRQQTIADDVIFFDTPDSNMKGMKIGLLMRIRKLLKESATKLIIAQRYKSVYLALLGSIGMPIPVLGVAHAFGVLDASARRFLLRRFRNRLTLAGVSEAVANDMRAQEKNLPIFCLHNCVDSEALEQKLLLRANARKKLGVADNEFLFGNVGRLHDDKDQATIIRAFSVIAADYPSAKLLLIGKGKRENDYHALIEQLGLQGRAILTGPVLDAATLFRAFDVYVSASDREPFGIVLTESMLARLPVISTNCGGAPEVLGDDALYFSRGDDKALAQAMEILINQSIDERHKTGEKLYDRLQRHFSFIPFCERLLALVNTKVMPS